MTDNLTGTGKPRTRRQFLSAVSVFGFLLLLAACSRTAASLLPVSVAPESAPPISIKSPRLDATSFELVDAVGQSPIIPSIPHRLELPSIDVDTTVVKLGWHAAVNDENQIFEEWDVAEYAAGWYRDSALPGETGNVILSGHNNILGSVFRRLDEISEGDEAILWSAGNPYVYQVAQVMIVPEKYAKPAQRAENAEWIGEFDDERLTLVSCWPRNDNTHRIIVVAHPKPKLQASTGR